MILVFNKTDVQDAEFAKEWMTDFEAFQMALKAEEDAGSFGGVEGGQSGFAGGSGYMGSLLNSMSLMLEEFYSHLSVVGVSSMTGQGVDEFFEAVGHKAEEFEREYKPELEKKRKEREEQKKNMKEKELGRMMEDMNVEESSSSTSHQKKKKEDPATLSDVSSSDDEEDGDGRAGQSGSDEEMDGEDGLSSRYKQALNDSSGGAGSGSKDDDHSFARYLRASNMR